MNPTFVEKNMTKIMCYIELHAQIFFPCLLHFPTILFSSHSKIFPKGLPEEYAIAAMFRVRRSTKKERWFLWQVLNQQNMPQVRNHGVVLRPSESWHCVYKWGASRYSVFQRNHQQRNSGTLTVSMILLKSVIQVRQYYFSYLLLESYLSKDTQTSLPSQFLH